ncbi:MULTISPECIES: cbb3-type cytochrome oxidase subunit 3 [Vibrio]|uniref:CcoQ/FixQ family Cbb3-type cytochrome c oxidase assembly chaperone n=1 Tax=Vibrio algicola TaxID=2662262 RepID=A0A5Q0TD01_9VIBR|nr:MULTISPECIES: CcoQ/FixQ family Cbb3-type cytochrome c oxidase assembly chaperone [Vibrio]MBD1575607.1 cbb3-type cytochrome oxidase subunit 3 [Vibrio sp. S11_S32]
MDIITIHSIWTLVIFFSFLGVVWWAYGSKKRQSRFDEAANSIFDDEPSSQENKKQGGVQ